MVDGMDYELLPAPSFAKHTGVPLRGQIRVKLRGIAQVIRVQTKANGDL